MPKKLNTKKISKVLGAKRCGTVRATGGYFGSVNAALAVDHSRNLKKIEEPKTAKTKKEKKR